MLMGKVWYRGQDKATNNYNLKLVFHVMLLCALSKYTDIIGSSHQTKYSEITRKYSLFSITHFLH